MKIKPLTLLLIFIAFVKSSYSQLRIETVNDALKLLGATKPVAVAYLNDLGFAHDSDFGNLSDFIKDTSYGSSKYTLGVYGNKVGLVSWSEQPILLATLIKEVKALGYVQKVAPRNGIYGFYKPSDNILISLVSTRFSKGVSVTIGKNDPTKPFKNLKTLTTAPTKPSKPVTYFEGTKSFCDEFWRIEVKITGADISFKSFNEDNQLKKTKYGIIKAGKIYIKEAGKLTPDLYQYENGKLLQLNYENSYNEYTECVDKAKTYSMEEVDIQPEYPGGIQKLYRSISERFIYPDETKDSGIEGRIILSFTVEPGGELTDIKVVNGLGHGLDEEAIRVLKLSRKWNPAVHMGRPVRCAYRLPLLIAP